MTLGDVAAFSFYPSKNLGGFGDGGMITTDDPQLARRMARLRVHGMEPKYHHHEVGFNSRLDALQAAVIRVKLRHLDAWTSLRREVAGRYRSLFVSHGLEAMVGLPVERPGNFHVYNQFVIRVPATFRDSLRDHLTARKIGTEIYYPIPLHLQACFASLGHKPGDFPQAEAAARQTIALPIYPELTDAEQRYVVGSIHQFLETRSYPSMTSRPRGLSDDQAPVLGDENEARRPLGKSQRAPGFPLEQASVVQLEIPILLEPVEALAVQAGHGGFRAAHQGRGLLLSPAVEVDVPERLGVGSGKPPDPSARRCRESPARCQSEPH